MPKSGISPTSHAGTDGYAVVYAGRFAGDLAYDQVSDLGCILSEWNVLPHELTALMEGAASLVILDLLSFPFEAIPEEHRDVPIVAVLPSDFDASSLKTIFDSVLFQSLEFFDYVVTSDSALWEGLRREYGWAEGQRLRIGSEQLGEVVAEICSLLPMELSTSTFFGGDEYDAVRYWTERGEALADSAPHKAICSVHHGLRFNKAMHLVQARALKTQFATLKEARTTDDPLNVLEVGAGVGRWARYFDPTTTQFTGIDISKGMVEAARANFPEHSFEHLAPNLTLPYDNESFDAVFSVTVMHHNPTPAKRILLSEMWRVAKPAARLMFLEGFVAGRQTNKATVFPMRVSEFMSLIHEETAGRVVLEHVESLRYPHDDMYRSAVISLSKIGIPETW